MDKVLPTLSSNLSMAVIAITGNLATGKTTVASMFAALGAKVLDADKIAHQLLCKNAACYSQVVEIFGKKILTHGSINRRKLGAIVFKDFKKLYQLEGIVHPAVEKILRDKILAYRRVKKIVVLDVPLLFESGLDKIVDSTIVVKASYPQQFQRAQTHLNISSEQIALRLQRQMELEEKVRLADFVIDNDGSMRKTKEQVRKIWDKLLKKNKN